MRSGSGVVIVSRSEESDLLASIRSVTDALVTGAASPQRPPNNTSISKRFICPPTTTPTLPDDNSVGGERYRIQTERERDQGKQEREREKRVRRTEKEKKEKSIHHQSTRALT